MLSAYCFVVLVAFVSVINGETGYLPSYIKPCSITDKSFEKCVVEQITNALPHFTKGDKKIGVPSLDPVKLNDIVIDGSGLKLTFSDAEMHGLSKSKLSQLKVHLGKEDEVFTLAFKCDFELHSKYVADGRILILPIQGNGDAHIRATGVEVVINSNFAHVKDGSGEHLKLSTPTYNYTIEKTTFDLQNLFNGNKELAQTTLKFANENWRQLMDELAPPAIKQIVRTCVKAINKFFSGVTIDQIVEGYQRRL